MKPKRYSRPKKAYIGPQWRTYGGDEEVSERMTGICLRDVPQSGIQDWGLKTPDEMIKQIRSWAEHNKKIADAILAAEDKDFHIDTYKGPWVQRGKEVIQEGRPK